MKRKNRGKEMSDLACKHLVSYREEYWKVILPF